MTTHFLQLAAAPFKAIISGNKTIESRLYDDKRQLIELGDIIVFTNHEAPEQMVSAKVVGLLRCKTFHDLFTRNNPTQFGGENIEWLDNQINQFYSDADQEKNGVLGIEFRLI